MNLHQYQKAQVYYQQSFRLAPIHETAQALAILFLKTDKPENALTYLKFLNQNNQSRVNYSVAQSLATDVVNCKTMLKSDSLNVELLNQIAMNYFKMQNVEIALKYAGRASKLDRQNKTSLELLYKINLLSKPKL